MTENRTPGTRMSDQTDSINIAPVDDVGPLHAVPDRIALCSEHGWWFEAKPGEACPQVGCRATVHHYTYAVAVIGLGEGRA